LPNAGFSWGAKLSEIADAIWTRSERKLTNLDDVRAAKIDNLDATISSRQPDAGLTSIHVGRIDAAISSRASASDYTSVRAAKLDNLDVAVSSRQPDAGLTPTHVGRIDTNISSRATEEGVWTYSNRKLTKAVSKIFAIASDNLKVNADSERHSNPPDMEKVKEILIQYDGIYRVKFDLRGTSSTIYARARIYRNGIEYGELREIQSTTYQTFSEDLVFLSGDLLQLYFETADTGKDVYVRNLRLYFDYNLEIEQLPIVLLN